MLLFHLGWSLPSRRVPIDTKTTMGDPPIKDFLTFKLVRTKEIIKYISECWN